MKPGAIIKLKNVVVDWWKKGIGFIKGREILCAIGTDIIDVSRCLV